MSRRKKTSPPPAAKPASPAGRSPVPWRWIAGLGAAAALGAGGYAGWRWTTAPRRLAAALPPLPARLATAGETAGGADSLAGRLARARARVAVRAESFAALEELGRLYHANGFPAEAAACWTSLQRAQPRDARWSRLLADAQRALSDYPAMEAALVRATALAPDDPAAWLPLAGLRFKTGRIDDAELAYRQRLRLLPGDAYAQLGLARCALQADRRDEARRTIEELVRTQPDFPPGYNLLAELQAAAGETERAAINRWKGRESGRFRDAEDPLLDGLAAWCLDPERLRTLGTVQFQTKRGDRGRALFERAVALAPADPGGYAALGELWLELREPARALENLLRARELSAGRRVDPNVFANLARAQRELGRPAETLATVQEGIRVCGDSPDLQALLGLAFADVGKFAEAEAAYRASLARIPQDANVRYNLAAVLLESGRRDAGKDELRAALQVQPTFPKALHLLGTLEQEDGRLAEAGACWRRLYESSPGMPEARRALATWHAKVGDAAQQRGDAAEAEKQFRAGSAVAPESPELSASLGVLLLVQGRVDEALGPLESYARGQPREPQAALFLGQAYARLGRLPEAKRELQRGARLADEAGKNQTAEFCREILRQLP